MGVDVIADHTIITHNNISGSGNYNYVVQVSGHYGHIKEN